MSIPINNTAPKKSTLLIVLPHSVRVQVFSALNTAFDVILMPTLKNLVPRVIADVMVFHVAPIVGGDANLVGNCRPRT